MVSTHAPRAGGDLDVTTNPLHTSLFQPTPPARGATCIPCVYRAYTVFQPTPPARGATAGSPPSSPSWTVSTHAPRAGGDPFKEG